VKKEVLKRWVPAGMIDLFRSVKSMCWYAEWEYIPEGWSYKKKAVQGWNVQSIVELQVQKWQQFKQVVKSPNHLGINHEAATYDEPDVNSHNLLMAFSYACAVAVRNGQIKLLDWGGGLGHYGVVAQEMLPNVQLEYHCFDLPLFREAINTHFKEATFINGVNSIGDNKYDLVNISSSLWYDPEWKQTLFHLAAATEGYLYITRMIFIEKEDTYVAIQRPSAMGYKTEYLFWVFNQHELIQYVCSLGFELLREFYLSGAPKIYRAPENGVFKGFLFIKRAKPTTTVN
jgi:putative methyltransferase (TIGR04325 family)